MALMWILGNLILNPVGWVLIPIVVAVVFHYRKLFTEKRLTDLKEQLEELEKKCDSGELSEEECQKAKDELLSKFVSAD